MDPILSAQCLNDNSNNDDNHDKDDDDNDNDNKAPLFDTIEHSSFRMLTAILLSLLCAMNILLLYKY